MVNRVSSLVSSSQLIENNLRLQAKYNDGQQQISSGLKSQTYEGIADDTLVILGLQSDQKRLEAQTSNAELVGTRIEIMYGNISNMVNVGQQFIADLSAAISGIGITTEATRVSAEQKILQTQTALNLNVGGRYVFAGGAINTPPVDITAAGYGPAVTPSVPNATYYQGDSYAQTVEVIDGLKVDYGVTADDPAFEQLLRAYDLVRNNPGDNATLIEAMALIVDGVDDLAELQSSLSVDATTLNNQIEQNKQQITTIQNLLIDLNDVDVAAVSTRLAEVQAQLEASYSVTTKLLRLSILDYL
jgi:flagellar hook-associated protein 3 FlgL